VGFSQVVGDDQIADAADGDAEREPRCGGVHHVPEVEAVASHLGQGGEDREHDAAE